MDGYQLLVNTHGAEAINEGELRSNQIAGMLIRINHIAEGHRLDENFTKQWSEAGAAGLLRIPYFIYNPNLDENRNYDWLVKHMPYEAGAVMLGFVAAPTFQTGIEAESAVNFFEQISRRWNFMIHTSERYLQLMDRWPQENDYWWAQYPGVLYPRSIERWTWSKLREKIDLLPGPANIDKVPGICWMWQATADRLILPGCDKPIGVNIYPGTLDELKEWVNEKESAQPIFHEEHSQPFEGVTLHKVYRFNSHCFVAVIDPQGKRFLVTKYGRKTVSSIAKEHEAQIVINGGDYNGYGAVGLHVSQGTFYRPLNGYEPWVNFTENNQPQINAHNSREKVFNSLAGKRFIVQDGQVSPNTSAAWREVHPRTLAGITQDGKFIECVIDGRQGPNNIGVNLFDAARVMIEFGAWKAIDLDGGGSSTMWVKDRVINTPIEGGVSGQERAVGTHIVMFVDEDVLVPKTRTYIVVRAVKPRQTPSMYEENTKPAMPVGVEFQTETARIITEKIPPETGSDFTIIWLQLPDGYWVPKHYKFEYLKEKLS